MSKIDREARTAERLGEDLRALRAPDVDAAEARSWLVLSSAYAERTRVARRGRNGLGSRARVALASTMAALLVAGLALTPAGAEVREWIGEAIAPGREDAKPLLAHLPAGGDLLVTSRAGAWIVDQDGSKRLLGDYEDATWSPHGLYVGASAQRELTAVDPGGAIRWSVARHDVSDPAWSPNDGYRVAYRSGDQLRVIWGDGTNDAALGEAADVTPSWQPHASRGNVLAYVDGSDRVRIIDSDSERILGRSAPLDRPLQIDWSGDGNELLALTRDSVHVLDPRGEPLWRKPFPPRAVAVAAAFRPGSHEVALVRRTRDEPVRSEVVRLRRHAGDVTEHRLFTGVGRFQGLAYSPHGKQLLVGWKDADQWLFLPSDGSGRVQAVGNITAQFDSGTDAGSFPEIEGWCCQGR